MVMDIGGQNEIELRGLTIPDDISVVGFDGIYLSKMLRHKRTTLWKHSRAEKASFLTEYGYYDKTKRRIYNEKENNQNVGTISIVTHDLGFFIGL